MKLFQFKRSAERDAFAVPRSVQASIPIKRIYKDGIFEVSGKFSKTWRFFDVNYKVASLEKQMELFMAYCAFLNSLPVNAAAKITLFNRRLNQKAFSSALMLVYEGDGQDQYRAEYNDLLTDKAADSN
ncbi:MAG: TraE family protein, partial [Oscillospiraceae bacterium]|nr:TraE family protein [Oscillospiraceae bacterium]